MRRGLVAIAAVAAAWAASDLESARDRQDRAALEKLTADAGAAEQKSADDAAAHYRAALAWSYLAEGAQGQRDNGGGKRAAEAGIRSAQRAVGLKPAIAA